MNDELLDKKQTAKILRISERTLDRLTDLPRVKLTERRILYRASDLTAWIARKVQPTAAAA